MTDDDPFTNSGDDYDIRKTLARLRASLARKDEALRACVEALEEVVDTTCAPNPTNTEEWRVASGHGIAFARAITKARALLARAEEAGR